MDSQYIITGSVPLPVCYTPGTILLVDDNHHFLDGLCLTLGFSQRCLPMSSARRAIDFLSTTYESLFAQQRWVKLGEEAVELDDDWDRQSVQLDLSGIRDLIGEQQRLAEIPLVIVDYAMPEMNGLSFCEQIRDLPCKKIILTGVTDLEVAVRGFNQGTIDQFIIKNSRSDFVEQLGQIVNEFRWQYFQDRSKALLDQLNLQSHRCALFETAYQRRLEHLFNELSLVEYYVLDRTGSVLLLDQQANISVFLVFHEQDIEAYADIARTTDGASANLVQTLANKQQAPYFFRADEQQLPVQYWDKHLYAIERLADTPFYTALITDLTYDDLELESIAPYNQDP